MITAAEPKHNDLMTADHVRQYWEEGYTIVKNVFTEPELNQIAQPATVGSSPAICSDAPGASKTP